jgi:16S rRNA C967 or C1407 C5-methylase (RsmB/RsmF family)/NOL1/NOP2/fmu family ribosome biogenesis protein
MESLAAGRTDEPLTLPTRFRERMRELLGTEADLLEASLARPPQVGLRVNTLKLSPSEFQALSPWPMSKVPWCPAGFVLDSGAAAAGLRPGVHPFHAAGLYYLQDPSAMAVAEVLAPRAGERILDLAAAPGGKSTHLASLSGDGGLLVANDVHGGRARELSRNLERWGTRRTVVTNSSALELAARWPERFDAVLLDAPCSGEGMFRKTPEALDQWSESLVAECAARQEALLPLAARLVRPGGRLVYSTCTLGPAENEQVVAAFLAGDPRWRTEEPDLPGVDRGRPDWAHGPRAGELAGAVRLWPHRSVGEGHFIALLRREPAEPSYEQAPEEAPERRTRRSAKGRRGASHRPGHASAALWREFIAGELTADPLPGFDLRPRPDGLYAVPPSAPTLGGLRVLRPGLWLGNEVRGRFVPSHALALGLRPTEAARTVDLSPDDPLLASYLRGAELDSAGDDGWVLVTVARAPVGWGRRARGIVKNHYPKGLRRPA